MYSLISGQPMAFIAPTGLTLAFISSLFSFCSLCGIPFLPLYSWVGIWTSCFMMLVSVTGAANLIRFCTKFTDDVFNALLSCNFIYEAVNSIKRNFLLPGKDKSEFRVCSRRVVMCVLCTMPNEPNPRLVRSQPPPL